MAIRVGEYPKELKSLMSQLKAREQAGSPSGAAGVAVGGGGAGMKNVVGAQAQQAGFAGGQVEDYAKAMRGRGEGDGLNEFLYGIDEYGRPDGYREGMALEEFGKQQMEQGGMPDQSQMMGGFPGFGFSNWDDPFADM